MTRTEQMARMAELKAEGKTIAEASRIVRAERNGQTAPALSVAQERARIPANSILRHADGTAIWCGDCGDFYTRRCDDRRHEAH